MLYVVPIEPINDRYSAQWLRWTKEYFYDKSKICYEILDPSTGTHIIKNGSFLDVVDTNAYKNKQMCNILDKFKNNKIKDGDVFWFHDLWFPGIEQLAYIRDGLGMKFKIYGYLHAGTYDKYDFLYQKGMRQWGEHFEQMLFKIVDKIFIATKSHKHLLDKETVESDNKFCVVPFPIYPDFLGEKEVEPHYLRQPIIVFPHRLDPEKCPDKFDSFARHLHMRSKEQFKFIKTKEEARSKSDYYDILKKAKYAISFSNQETWGIAMQEAVLCGCIPVVPSKLSYTEMYPPIFRYDTGSYNSADIFNAVDKVLALENTTNEYVGSSLYHLASKFKSEGASAFKILEPWLFPNG